MPYECRKDMKWGPGRDPVQLRGGDEVPAPVKKVLVQRKYVVEVDEVSGKRWADQPEQAQKAWAEANGRTYLVEKRQGSAEPVKVLTRVHPTRLVGAEESDPPSVPKLQGAAVEATPVAEPVAPSSVPKVARKKKTSKKRGRPRKS